MSTLDSPVVSVLMTCFNRERFIASAIESVLSSTFKDFELIVVDDCSTDRSVSIVESYAKADSRVKLFINEVNLGDYGNRHKAACLASGRYLKYVDSDDIIYPHGLEILVQSMQRFPKAGYGLCSLEPDRNFVFPFELDCAQAYRRNFFESSLFHKAPLSAIILRSAYQAIGGFKNIRLLGDFDLWHRLSKDYSVVLMQQGLVWYREHEEQEMSGFYLDRSIYIDYLLNSYSHVISESCPLPHLEKLRAKRLLIKRMFSIAVRHAIKMDFRSTLKIVKYINCA